MNIQWYPGHMTKARRMMQENIKLIDVVIELVDSRLPYSSKNPDIDALANGKYRILLMAKSDMADPKITAAWEKWYRDKGFYVMSINGRSKTGIKGVNELIMEASKEKIERDRRRGIKNRPVRAMIAGIPNVGKSTFINSFAGKAAAKTGNKPGVTRGKQWIRLNQQVEMLDTPGLLWPKFEDQSIGLKLAASGSINDDILDTGEICHHLIAFLLRKYPDALATRYQVDGLTDAQSVLEAIAAQRGALKSGGIADLDKACALLLDDFRSLRLGRITLEEPDDLIF